VSRISKITGSPLIMASCLYRFSDVEYVVRIGIENARKIKTAFIRNELKGRRSFFIEE
jgi:hypothetical protein